MMPLKRVEIRNGQIVVGYQWPARSTGKLSAVVILAEDQERLRVYQERLALLNSSPEKRDVPLTELYVALFELATFRSQQFSAVDENRAALVVLAFYVNGKSLGRVLPAADNWPRPTEQVVTLNGRDDFAKHFIVSAALAASAGSPLSGRRRRSIKKLPTRVVAAAFHLTTLPPTVPARALESMRQGKRRREDCDKNLQPG